LQRALIAELGYGKFLSRENVGVAEVAKRLRTALGSTRAAPDHNAPLHLLQESIKKWVILAAVRNFGFPQSGVK
jgi:hypothetical protein